MLVNRAANSDTFKVTTPSDTQIEMTRLFDAPKKLVFEVLTRPEHVRRWWGNMCDEVKMTVCEIDFRVGGKWRFVTAGGDGETAFNGVYEEIAPYDRFVHTEIFEMFPDNGSLVSNVLTEEQGKTRLTVVSTYESKEVRDMVLSSGMEVGAAAGYDHVERLSAELTAR